MPLPTSQPSATEDPGLIAILRGLTPQEAPAIGETLYELGYRRLEVPLNSPDPFESIRILTQLLPDAVVGAGTVVTTEDVDRVHAAGGRLVVAPNTDPAVIARTAELGMVPYPGVATATDVFAALRAGATALKLFPASVLGIDTMVAWAATVPSGTRFLPVGGVDASNLRDWLEAGAGGAGLGTTIYAPGTTAAQLRGPAEEMMSIWTEHHV